jgi:hypothetical protein
VPVLCEDTSRVIRLRATRTSEQGQRIIAADRHPKKEYKAGRSEGNFRADSATVFLWITQKWDGLSTAVWVGPGFTAFSQNACPT